MKKSLMLMGVFASHVCARLTLSLVPKISFGEFKLQVKFKNPRRTPSGRKVKASERGIRNNAVFKGYYYIQPAIPKGSAHTVLELIWCFLRYSDIYIVKAFHPF